MKANGEIRNFVAKEKKRAFMEEKKSNFYPYKCYTNENAKMNLIQIIH